MYRFFPYAVLFVVVSLLQVLFFNNLSVSVYLSPLVYVIFIVLLPLQMSHLWLLLAGLFMGVVMDSAFATAGLNTIATLFVAFFRPYLLALLAPRDGANGSGIPSESLLGDRVYVRYLISMVLIHCAIFFAFESLSFENLRLYLVRFVVSAFVSVLFVWLIGRAFMAILFKERA